MAVLNIDHIGIAVHELEKSAALWQEIFGFAAPPVETLEERGVRIAHLKSASGPSVELIEPLRPDAAVSKFLKERGEGIHHICFRVQGLEAMMDSLRKKGVEFIQDWPVAGAGGSRVAFIHPRSAGGVLVELKEID